MKPLCANVWAALLFDSLLLLIISRIFCFCFNGNQHEENKMSVVGDTLQSYIIITSYYLGCSHGPIPCNKKSVIEVNLFSHSIHTLVLFALPLVVKI